MPPSAIHMDHIRSQIRHQQAASLDRQTAEIGGDGASTGKSAPKSAKDDGQGMSFWDVLDVVNPLQHIPGVNKIYQAITGDTIKTPAKIAGAALFFGPIGIAVAAADAVVEKETGKDTLDHVASALGLEKDAAPVDDDPFTVTAQRLPKQAAATPAPVQPAPAATPAPASEKIAAAPAAPAHAGQPVELSSGQAALLESLMGSSQTAAPHAAPAPPSVPHAAPAATAGSISANAPATGGIATARQLKELESTPGASAALSAARGLGSSAVIASLPTPGASGAGDNLLASMGQEQAKGARTGKGLAEYRAAAISNGSMDARPLIPSRATQMVQNGASNMPGANYTNNPLLTTRTAGTTATPAGTPAAAAPAPAAPPSTASAAVPPVAAAPVQTPGQAQALPAPTPVPKEQIADMMARAMSKYEAQARRKTETGTATIH